MHVQASLTQTLLLQLAMDNERREGSIFDLKVAKPGRSAPRARFMT
jgi:hypothetical protein